MVWPSSVSAPTLCCSQIIRFISFTGSNTLTHLFKPLCCCCSLCNRTNLFIASRVPEPWTHGNGVQPQLHSSQTEWTKAPINQSHSISSRGQKFQVLPLKQDVSVAAVLPFSFPSLCVPLTYWQLLMQCSLVTLNSHDHHFHGISRRVSAKMPAKEQVISQIVSNSCKQTSHKTDPAPSDPRTKQGLCLYLERIGGAVPKSSVLLKQ